MRDERVDTIRSRRQSGQPERLAPVAQVGPHALARELAAASASVASGPSTRRRFALELAHLRAVAQPRSASAMRPNIARAVRRASGAPRPSRCANARSTDPIAEASLTAVPGRVQPRRRTCSIRCSTVTTVAAASTHSAAGRTYGTPTPARTGRDAAPSTSRSLRSAIPTLHGPRPSPSARAFAYDTTSAADQADQRAPRRATVVARRAANHEQQRRRRPRASATRSRVESRNAPHRLAGPDSRAIVPSRVSENTNAVMTTVPDPATARAGRTRQRGGADPDGADEGDGVGETRSRSSTRATG